jgi:cobalt/nickel transport system permease protein
VLGLSLSVEGCWAAWNIVAKATLGVLVTSVLAATTSVVDVLRGLDRLRVPKVLTGIMGFMVRYGEVVGDEMRRMRIARLARAGDPRWFWQARAVAASAGALFIRSFERGERVHLAMLAREYQGSMPVLDASDRECRWPAFVLPATAAVVASTAWWLRFEAWPSPTPPATRCCSVWTSRSPRASGWRSSARTGPARPRSSCT